MNDLDPAIQAYIEAANKLNAAIREAHGLIKDMDKRIAQVRELERTLPRSAVARIEATVTEGLKVFDEELEQAIKLGEQAVYKRFDSLGDALMGVDSKAEGPPLRELMRAAGENMPPAFRRKVAIEIHNLNRFSE
jgi:hypothetical protein